MRYLSVCSGIESATVAWHPLGWQCAGVSEIEPFPRAVLEQRVGAVPVEWDHRHQPGSNTLPLFGDFTQIEAHHVGPIDLLVGGTPCQSFSVAGKRLGLDDPRGNLTLEFLALAKRIRPRWLVWENVPGVLSHDDGRTFGTFLGLLAECGFERWAYRVLDAQYVRVGRFGRAVPQRRRRVFVVGYSGAAAIHPRAVLFDRESLRGNPAPRREAGEGVARDVGAGAAFGGGNTSGPIDIATAQTAHGTRLDFDTETFVAHALRGEGFDASEDGTGRGTPIVPVQHPPEVAGTLKACGGKSGLPNGAEEADRMVPIAFSAKDYGNDALEDCSPTLRAGGHTGSHANAGVMPAVAHRWGVRRLTPTECERLQGFPDGWTKIEWRGKGADQCPDGPRYKALGNSKAVNVVTWIGERIAAVEAIAEREREAA